MTKNDARSQCHQQQAVEPSRNENHMHLHGLSVALSAPNNICREAILLDQRTRPGVQHTAKRRLCSANRLVNHSDAEPELEQRRNCTR